jgi:hypothetical protein
MSVVSINRERGNGVTMNIAKRFCIAISDSLSAGTPVGGAPLRHAEERQTSDGCCDM